MAEYIEREVVDKVIDTARKMYLNDFGAVEVVQQIKSKLCNMPNADVQPIRRGHWIEKPPYKDETVKDLEFQIVCSECDEQNCSIEFDECYNPIGKTFYKTRYCPNCGADMREHEPIKG